MNQQQIKVKASDEVLEGKYANNMQVAHTKEEFIMDFISLLPPHGTLNARIITSPAHLKRIVKALQGNVKKYEDKYGTIEYEDNGPSGQVIDFLPKE